jgi:trk system potassium uptake protein TrkA
MRVALAGAGNVGQSIARALLADGHKVLLIERERAHYRPELVPQADWLLADACELAALQSAGVDTAHVVIAATGDDKANLVVALLCKREFAVPRVVARVNSPANQWLFTADWGVDVAVSTPGRLVAAVEEVVTTGDVIHLMTLHGQGAIVALTVPSRSRLAGMAVSQLRIPVDAALLAVTRAREVLPPEPGLVLQAGDEIVLLAAEHAEAEVRDQLRSSVG